MENTNEFGFASQDGPPAPAKEQPYPRLMYGPHGAEKKVESAVEERHLGEGWSRRRPAAPPVPTPADAASQMAKLEERVSNLESAYAKLMAKK